MHRENPKNKALIIHLFAVFCAIAALGCDSAFSDLAHNPSDSDSDVDKSDNEGAAYSMLITPTWGNQGASVKILGELLELPAAIKEAFLENPFVYVAERNFGSGIHFKEWRVTASPAGFSATILIDDTAPPTLRNVWVDFVAGDYALRGQGAFYVLSSQRDGDYEYANENPDNQDADLSDGEDAESASGDEDAWSGADEEKDGDESQNSEASDTEEIQVE